MGSSKVQTDVVLAELDFIDDENDHGGNHQLQTRDHRKHKKKKAVNSDADIVTPYQNGIYYPLNGRHNPHIESACDFLSPPPPLIDERGVHSSLSSVNNAITVAPSRTNLTDSNVFVGGRPTNHNHNSKRPNNRNNRHQYHKHKGRSRTPDFSTSSNHRLRDDEPHDSQSILNRIDLSIRKNFGDWDNDDEAEMSKKLFNSEIGNNKTKLKTPYFIPKGIIASDSDVTNLKDDVNLPRLFKNYENVVTTSRQVLNDKSYKIALSRDNADPNSILSQAKKTLSYVSGQ